MSLHDYLDNLIEARNRAWSEADELLARATAEQREFTAEEQAKWEAINADLDHKDEQIRSFQEREQRERAAMKAASIDAAKGSRRTACLTRRDARSCERSASAWSSRLWIQLSRYGMPPSCSIERSPAPGPAPDRSQGQIRSRPARWWEASVRHP